MTTDLPIINTRAFPPVLDALMAAADETDVDVYVVGGAVRNALLELPVVDLDILMATWNRTEALNLISTYAQHVRGHMAYMPNSGAWQVRCRRAVVEFVMFDRLDIKGVEDDLRRRDFTVNALAMHPKGYLVDSPTVRQGVEDLHVAVLSCPGPAEDTFRADPLRMLRACRFASEYGFILDMEVKSVMKERASWLSSVAVERIGAELSKILMSPWPAVGLYAMQMNGLLPWVSPSLSHLVGLRQGSQHIQDAWGHTVHVVRTTERREDLRWAALYHDVGKAQTQTVDAYGEIHFYQHEHIGAGLAELELEALRRPKAQIQRVTKLVEMHMRPRMYETSWKDSAVRRLVRDAGDDLQDLLALAYADSACHRDESVAITKQGHLHKHIQKLSSENKLKFKLAINGHDVMGWLNLQPGRAVGDWLKLAEEAVIEGYLPNNDLYLLSALTAWQEGREAIPEFLVKAGDEWLAK